MLKMFNLIDIGERTGSGIPNIFRVWREQSWIMPAFTEQFETERTILMLTFEKTAAQKAAGTEYLTDHNSGSNADFAELLGLKSTRVKELLRAMVSEGIVVAEGNNRKRIYKLKS